MAEGNFEKAGIALEIQGFTQYINNLKEVDDAHIKTSVVAGQLSEKLTNLETIIKNALSSLTKIRFDSEAMGIKDVSNDVDKTKEAVGEFKEEMSEAAKALKKLEAISSTIETFDRLTLTLLQNTASLKEGFDRIQLAIKDIDMDKLTDSAVKAADSIQKLAVAMGNLETAMGGNKLVTNLGKLIPLLLAAGDIKKLGAVGKGIASLINGLAKIGTLPNFAQNQDNFNALIRFIDRLSLLRLPPGLPQDLINLGDALHKMVPGVKEINKVKLDKHTTDGIDALLTTLNKFSSINTSGFASLATGIEQIAIAFRSFGSGGQAGARFTGAAVAIAIAIEQILKSLQAFVGQQDAPKFIAMVGQLGDAIKIFAQGMNALGRDFANTIANVPAAITIITQSIIDLQQSISGIKDVDVFATVLKKLGDGAKALQSGFSALGRSKTLRQDLTESVQSIIDAITKLSNSDMQNAAIRIQGMVGPITQLAEAFKLLRKQRFSDDFLSNIEVIGGSIGPLNNIINSIKRSLISLGAGFINFAKQLGLDIFKGIIQGFIKLGQIIAQVAVFIYKLPLKVFEFGLRAITIPLQLVNSLLEKFGNLLSRVFTRDNNIGRSLGFENAASEINEFDARLQKTNSTFRETEAVVNSASRDVLNFGDAAKKASADVSHLDRSVGELHQSSSVLGRIFGGGDLLRAAGTFKAVDIAGDLVTDMLYGMVYGFRTVIGEAITATSNFEQLTLQLTSLQAKELVGEGLFPDVPTALIEGAEVLQENVDGLINQFRILAIQSPFETSDVVNAFKTAQAFGFATDEAKALVTTLVDAGSALGFAGNDLKEVARIFGQIRTLGKIQAEDMNQLSERGIGVREALIAAGATAQEVADGTVKADFAIRVLTNTLNKDFTGAAIRSANSIEGLLGSFRSFREEALRTFTQPIVEGIKPIFSGLAEILFTPEVFDRIEAAGERVAATVDKVIIAIASIAGVVSNIFGAIPQPIIDFGILLAKAAGIAIAATTAFIGIQFVVGTLIAAFAFAMTPIGTFAALIFLTTTTLNAFVGSALSFSEVLQSVGSILASVFAGDEVAKFNAEILELPKGLQAGVRTLTEFSYWLGNVYNTIEQLAAVFVNAFNFGVFTDPTIKSLSLLDESMQRMGLTIANIGAAFGRFYDYLSVIAQNIYTSVSTAFNNLVQVISDAFGNIFNYISGVITSLYSMGDNVATFLNGLIENVGNFGVGVIEAFASGMLGAVNLVVSAVQAIADAITWLLEPGSPPRALPNIDKWGEELGQVYVDGISEADTASISQLTDTIGSKFGDIKIPEDSTLSEFMDDMNWKMDDSGNVVDVLGNIIISQDQLAASAAFAADELERVNEELAALDRAQSIQKQQNLVNNLKSALTQPGISQSNRMVLEQQLKRAELELRRLQLEAEQEGLAPDGSGSLGGGSGSSGGSKTKTPKVTTPKDVKEPTQKLAKIDKAIAKTGKKLKDVFDLPVPDMTSVENAFGSPDTGTGLLGRIQTAFDNAKNGIGESIRGIRTIIETELGKVRDVYVGLYNILKPVVEDTTKLFVDSLNSFDNPETIVGGVGGLAGLLGATLGWKTLFIIASGVAAIGAAWAVASGQVDLKLPEELKEFQAIIDEMRSGFTGATERTVDVGDGVVAILPGKSLAESIVGFSADEFALSVGVLLAGMGNSIGGIFTHIDTSISAGITANTEGENPIVAFFKTLFDPEVIKTTITELLKDLDSNIKTTMEAEIGEGLGAITFVPASIGDVGIGTGLDTSAFGNIIKDINEISEGGLPDSQFGKDVVELGGAFEKFWESISVIGDGASSGFDRAVDLIEKIDTTAASNITQNLPKVSDDVIDLGKAFKEISESLGLLTGVAVGATAAVSIIASIETLAKTPSIMESTIQILDNFLRTMGNLVLAIVSLDDPTATITALGNAFINFAGIFTELDEINDDLFSIISSTVDSIILLSATLTGIDDPDAYLSNSVALTATITGVLSALAAFVASTTVNKTVAALVTNGPKILQLIKELPKVSLMIVALSGVTAFVKKFDEENENVDFTAITQALDSINQLLLVYTLLPIIPGGKFAQAKIAAGAIGIINMVRSILVSKGLIMIGPRLPLLKGIQLWITASLLPFLKVAGNAIGNFAFGKYNAAIGAKFLTLAASLTKTITAASISLTQFLTGGISAGSAAAVTGIVTALTAAVLAIVGAFIAFQKDIGGLRTETVLPAFEALTTFVGKVFGGFAKFFQDGLNLDAAGAQARADANVQVINAFSGLLDAFMDILAHHDGSAIQLVADTFASAMGGVIDMVNSLMGTQFETDLTGGNNPLAPIIEFVKGIEEFVVAIFSAIGLLNNTEDAVSVLDKINAFVDIVTAFANLNPLTKDVDLKGNGIVQQIIDFVDVFVRLASIDLQGTDRVIVSILSVTDAIGFLSNLNLDRVGAAVRIMTLLIDTFLNPRNAVSNALSIGSIISTVTAQVNDEIPALESGVDRYLQAIGKANAPQVIEPPIIVEPKYTFPDDNPFGDPDAGSGIFSNNQFGDPDAGVEVPVKLHPIFDSTEFNSSGSIGGQVVTELETLKTSLTGTSLATQTEVTAAFTTMNTNVTTQATTLKTTVDTGFAAVTASMLKGAVDGGLAFITELGLLPGKTEVPLDAVVETANSYGGETGSIAVAGLNLGIDFADGYIAGVESKKQELINAVAAYAQAGLDTIPRVQQSASASKITYKLGIDFDDGFIKGVGSPKKKQELMGVAARFAQAGVDQVVTTITSSKNQAAIKRVMAALLPDVFRDKGLKIDFSNWEIVSDSETDVSKRALDSATNIAEQFGNSFARVTNQIFDEIIGSNMGLAPSFFNSEEINTEFTKQIDAIFKHREDTLNQFGAEGKAIFDRNFLAAFTNPEGVKAIAQDFLNQFSDDDFFNLPKIYGAIDGFVGSMRARLEEQAQAGDGWAMSMLGGLENLDKALKDNVQSVINEMSAEGEDAAEGATSVGTAISNNIASGTTSTQSLGGLDSAVTTLAGTLVSTITTEFAKITAIITGQGAASSTGFITGVDGITVQLPETVTAIVDLLGQFADDFYVAGQDLGEMFADGYISGILLKIKELEQAAKDMVAAVEAAAKLAQDSKSPSKKAMEIGKDFADGYAIGITSAIADIAAAGTEMVAAATAPILENGTLGNVKQGTFWIDENNKFESPVDPNDVDEAVESMNALERAAETAQKIFDSFGESFGDSLDSTFDKFLELNPDAIADIWDIGPIRDAATSVAEELRNTLDAIGEELTPSGQSKFGELIKQMFGDEDTIKTLIDSFLDSFSPEELATLPDAANAIDTFIRQIEDVLLEDEDYEGFLKEMGLTDDVAGGFSGIAEKLREGIQAALDAIAEEEVTVPETPSWIEDMFGSSAPQTEQVGEDLTAGIAAGITSPTAINGLQTAASIAIEAFLNELRNAGDIHSPSRLTMKLAGEPLVDGIIVGMKNRMPNMLKTARNIGDTVAHSFGTGDWLRQNTFDQRVNLKYNGLVNTLPELFQKVNRGVIGGASKLKDNMLMAGENNARTGMLTNYSVMNNSTNSQDEYHLHMDVDRNQLSNVRRGFRVAKQLGIN